MTETPNVAGASNPDASSCVPWGFWASTGFGILSILAWLLFQWLAAVIIFAWLGINTQSTADEIKAVASHGAMIAAATIGAMPAAVAVLALAARLARCRTADYLALVRPERPDLLLGLAILVVLLPLGDLSSWLTGRDIVPAFVVEAYRTARASNTVVIFILALVVAAPLMEELLFRGFLLRGYAASSLGPIGAVLLTSAAWASLHIQYEVFYIVQIFILGCVFGWLRLRSGSTTLTLILHGLVNLTAVAQTIFIAERAA